MEHSKYGIRKIYSAGMIIISLIYMGETVLQWRDVGFLRGQNDDEIKNLMIDEYENASKFNLEPDGFERAPELGKNLLRNTVLSATITSGLSGNSA